LTEYQRIYAENIRIDTDLFTSSFFTLTGFHGLHVFIGLIALAVVGAMAAARDFEAGRRRVVLGTLSIYRLL
jgi:cytochrome c oxidase subunit III